MACIGEQKSFFRKFLKGIFFFLEGGGGGGGASYPIHVPYSNAY